MRLLAALAALSLGVAPDGGAGRVARWTFVEPSLAMDAGATDLVELSLGASVEVPLPMPAVMTVCDAPLASVELTDAGVRLAGRERGLTHCGLWFYRNAFPQRLVEVRVIR